MAEQARHLRPVENGELPVDGPSYGETLQRLHAAEDMVIGQEATIKSQAAMLGRLKRQLEETDVASHPRGKEIVGLIERWKRATNHPRAKVGATRVKLVKARLKDGYSIADLELAIDGLGAFPYRSYDRRLPTGTDAQREDDLTHALCDEKHVERMANLGHRAHKQGLVKW